MVTTSWSFAIICAGAILSLLLFFGFIVLMRYINFKENLALAEKGFTRPPATKQKRKNILIWGIMVASVGLALCLGLYPLGLSGTGTQYPLGLGPWMIGGFLPLFVGIGLILVYVLSGEEESGRIPQNANIEDVVDSSIGQDTDKV
ncbi:MAG: hypothetical protein GX577_03530 [Leptolinea sp.]|nr:hypothetical protein [Leptolinea sp.]